MRPGFKKIIRITLAVFALLMILVLSFAYIQYRELKKTLVHRISGKATAVIGQKVEIGDLSFSPSAGINLYNLTVRNPEGFAPGELLKIRKIFLKMRHRELLKRKFHFENITVYEPQLTVARDNEGRMNLSEGLINFFKRKPTLTYHIDKFEIESGSFDFNQVKTFVSNSGTTMDKNPPFRPFAKGVEPGLPGKIFRNDNINVQVKNLSSNPGIRTSISGHTTLAGSFRIAFGGWAYLKDEPIKLNVSVSARDISPEPLKELLNRSRIGAEKARINFHLSADGDTRRGFLINSEVGIKEAGFTFFKKDVKEILFKMKAFLNIAENSLSLESISLQSGGVTSAVLKGEIKKVKEDFLYTAGLKIGRLDLAAFNLMKDIKVSGIVTSDNLNIRGSFKKIMPEISGAVQLSEGALRSQDTDIGKINARITFPPGKEMAVRAEAAAEISKVKGYALDKPAGAVAQMTARGDMKKAELLSSVNLSPVTMRIKGEKTVHAENLAVNLKSNVSKKAFSGEILLNMKGIRYDTYKIPWLRWNTGFAYSGNIMTFKSPAIEGEDLAISAKKLTAILPEKKTRDAIRIKMEDMNASYPKGKAEIRKTALSLKLNTGGKALSGYLGFSIGEMLFGGFRSGSVQGRGTFDEKYFTLDIPRAEVSGGSMKLSAKGRSSGGPFPLTVTTSAENINLADTSGEALKIADIPYGVSGNIKTVIFEGTASSGGSIKGRAEIEAEKISLINRDKRNIVQGVSLKSGIVFRGNDLDFTSHVNAGKISAGMSGTVNRFMQKDRTITAKIIQPGTNITDIREALWDAFPDSLLYAGLEGSFSGEVTIHSAGSEVKAGGKISVKDFVLRGENDEYSIGPVNGVIPLAYEKTGRPREELQMRPFARAEFDRLVKEYSEIPPDTGYNKITIGSLRYGFELLKDITLWVKQEGWVLNVDRFSGNIFGGRLNGAAVVAISDGLAYRAGLLVEGMSLTKLCDRIEPIKGYISGRVNGVANIKGSGTGLGELIGKADIWTYSTREEKTKISREFLKKMGGPSVKAYLGDRKFDKGNMIVYLQNGYIIFEELEISNRNFFGIQDLSIKVAPHSNRIAIDHLMWSIVEAAGRAKEK